MNRLPFLSLETARRSVRRGGMVAVILTASLCAGIPSARADETTRRIQEELRKRNLFFGDVDGRATPQLSAALHRYQERKGFSSTGEADADTLYSLNILRSGDKSSHLASNVPSPTMPPPLDARDGGPTWPDVTVLRSDAARPAPPPGEIDAAIARAETALAVATATPAPPPASAAVLRRPTVEQVREFLTRYLQAGQANDPETEMRFYGDHVAYYDEGVVDQPYISRDVSRYDHRWPERRFTLLDPVTVSDAPDGDTDKFVVNFRYGFNVKNARYAVGGKTDNTWIVAGHDPGSWKIVSMKEQRVREK